MKHDNPNAKTPIIAKRFSSRQKHYAVIKLGVAIIMACTTASDNRIGQQHRIKHPKLQPTNASGHGNTRQYRTSALEHQFGDRLPYNLIAAPEHENCHLVFYEAGNSNDASYSEAVMRRMCRTRQSQYQGCSSQLNKE